MSEAIDTLVVGAGVGGLSAAVRLAAAGQRVHVVERAPGPGGRCARIDADGYKFDTGPTILLLKPIIEELFQSVGRKLEDYLTLVPCTPNYLIHFSDGARAEFTSDLRRMQTSLEAIEPGSFSGYLRYLEEGRRGLEVSLDRFVTRNFDTLASFATPGNLQQVFAVNAHRSLYSVVSKYFQDERLRIALSFQTMYLGISPHEAPGVYALLPYTELADGIWFPMGGLYALPLAIERLAKELGVTFEYGATVDRITVDGDRVTGVRLEDGTVRTAARVLANADLPFVYRKLIPEARLPRAEKLKYTSSAYMLYLGLDGRAKGLEHHNVFLAESFKKNFDEIFGSFTVPDDPSFYVNVPTRTDPSLGPEGCDQLYVLVPVPHQHPNIDWKEAGPKLRAKVFERLAREGYGDLEKRIVVERVCDPDGWAEGFNLERGAAFGLSHNFFQVGYFRPSNQDATFSNLFFVGASTQPGTGLPMVMLSARLVSERILGSPATEAAA